MFVLLAGIEMYFNLHTGNINLQTGIYWIIRFQLMTESRVLRQMRIEYIYIYIYQLLLQN